MKKLIPFLFIFLLLPGIIFAGGEYVDADGTTICYDGFVPCGKPVLYGSLWEENDVGEWGCTSGGTLRTVHCTFCHFFIMINGTVSYVLTSIIPILAIFMLVIGGIMYFLGGANPNLITTGRSIVVNVGLGLLIAYGSYILIGTLLTILGVTNVTLLKWGESMFSFTCTPPGL